MSPLIWLAHATLVARRMFPDFFLEDSNKVLIASQVIDYIARDGVPRSFAARTYASWRSG